MESRQQGPRIGAVLAVLALALACQQQSAPAALDDTPENRTAQIQRYFEAMPPENLLKDMLDRMAMQVPGDQRARFVDLMTKSVDTAKIRSIMQDGMAKHFTADETRALADFYGSAIGKSAMAKFGAYMTDVMPAIQGEIVAAVGKIQHEFEEKAAPAEPPKQEPPKQEPPKQEPKKP